MTCATSEWFKVGFGGSVAIYGRSWTAWPWRRWVKVTPPFCKSCIGTGNEHVCGMGACANLETQCPDCVGTGWRKLPQHSPTQDTP